MKITTEMILVFVAIINGIGIPVIIWGARKLTQIHRGNKYSAFQVDTLVDVTSKQFGNGAFRKSYDTGLKEKMEKHNFIYKG